jgi:hypothetical protein
MKSIKGRRVANWAAAGLWVAAAIAAARKLAPAAIEVVKKRYPLRRKGVAAGPKS